MDWNRSLPVSVGGLYLRIAPCRDGGVAVLGTTGMYGSGRNDFWLVRANSTGQLGWVQSYGGPYSEEA